MYFSKNHYPATFWIIALVVYVSMNIMPTTVQGNPITKQDWQVIEGAQMGIGTALDTPFGIGWQVGAGAALIIGTLCDPYVDPIFTTPVTVPIWSFDATVSGAPQSLNDAANTAMQALLDQTALFRATQQSFSSMLGAQQAGDTSFAAMHAADNLAFFQQLQAGETQALSAIAAFEAQLAGTQFDLVGTSQQIQAFLDEVAQFGLPQQEVDILLGFGFSQSQVDDLGSLVATVQVDPPFSLSSVVSRSLITVAAYDEIACQSCVVPEPQSLALLSIGVLSLLFLERRRGNLLSS